MHTVATCAQVSESKEMKVQGVEDFVYTGPLDGSVAAGEGVVLKLSGDARVMIRLSGTGSSGKASMRIYLEEHEPPRSQLDVSSALEITKRLLDATMMRMPLPKLLGSSFKEKMLARKPPFQFINFWLGLFELCKGKKGVVLEKRKLPVAALPDLAASPPGDESFLCKTVVMRLNGGLGITTGLDKAKSLLKVKESNTFMDLIVEQEKQPVRFMLFNSFSTEADTKAMKNFSGFPSKWGAVSLKQYMAPKVPESMARAKYPKKPNCEWWPPWHGDIYAALLLSGTLDPLLKDGYKRPGSK